jgi:CMP-N,N'-diacetyllegionaminic acid synthase
MADRHGTRDVGGATPGGARILGVIPARGGSKGLPRKNVLELGGKPLICWTIEAAQRSSLVERVVLSSDDEEIITIAREMGCDVPFVRPPHLATDEATAADVMAHCLDAVDAEEHGFTHVVLLQPTSPLRQAEDIDGAILTCLSAHAPLCVSVAPLGKNVSWLMRLDGGGRMSSILDWAQLVSRRQDATSLHVLNGAVYVARIDHFRTHQSFFGEGMVGYVMPPERSVDIDSELDLIVCDALLGLTGR